MTDITQAADKTGTNQLDKLSAEFERWRKQKKTRVEQIPESLLQEALKLTEYYKTAHVRRRLGLSTAQMKKLTEINKPTEQVSSSNEFMTLIPHSPDTVAATKELKIEVCTAKGLKITLSGTAEQDPLAIIAKFIED